MPSIWTPELDQRLQYLAGETHLAAAARQMGLRVNTVWARAYHKKIKAIPLRVSREPTVGEWIGIASAVAREAGLPAKAILGRHRDKRSSQARWRAWRRLLDEYPEYSIAGLARAANYNHTSVIYGLRRLREIEYGQSMVNDSCKSGKQEVQSPAP